MKTLINTLKIYFKWFSFELRGITPNTQQLPPNLKSALLTSYCLPPQFNSGTHRPASLLKYAHENDWCLTGMTNPNEQDISEAGTELFNELPSKTQIGLFVSHYEPSSWRFTPEVDGGFAKAVALASAIIEKKPSILIASGPPFYFWIASLWAARVLKIPLILDYRDEWSLCPFNFVQKTPFNTWFEKRCIKHAKLIIYTTQTHQEAHANQFNIPSNKQALIFNGWESDKQQSQSSNALILEKDRINISYLGKLSGHVDLAPFFSCLTEVLENIKNKHFKISVNFIGDKSPQKIKELNQYIENKDLKFNINIYPQIKQSQTINLMKASDYLLLLGNKNLASYIPGKIYDYLSTRTPIIAYGYEGEVSKILSQFNHCQFVTNNDAHSLQQALAITKNMDKDNEKKLARWLDTKTRKNQAKLFFNAIEQSLFTSQT
ncbi:glycosyltransferase [Colwellia sp. MEBiC06753]